MKTNSYLKGFDAKAENIILCNSGIFSGSSDTTCIYDSLYYLSSDSCKW